MLLKGAPKSSDTASHRKADEKRPTEQLIYFSTQNAYHIPFNNFVTKDSDAVYITDNKKLLTILLKDILWYQSLLLYLRKNEDDKLSLNVLINTKTIGDASFNV